MKTSLSVLLTGALVAACSSGGSPNAAPPLTGVPPSSDEPPGPGSPDAGGSTADGGGVTPDGSTPEPDGLPFPYARAQAGTPVPASELAAITDEYIQLLTQTRYFDTVDERVHGWPESDPQKRYWYGTWWSGCGLDKANGVVTYNHVDVGADNNGIPTSSVLEGMCQAHRLWPSAKLEKLVRRLVRGLNAYSLAMKRSPNDTAGVMLARTIYPAPIAMTDGGRNAYIAYDADRPGIDSYTQYVHIPQNPTWGDIYVKNKRSKDDVGHMLRALGSLDDCLSGLGPDAKADVADARSTYAAWARRVEADGWAIASLDTNAQPEMPALNSTMSRYQLAANAECDAALALRLFGGGAAGTLDCGNGVHPLEGLVMNNPSNGEIVRSYHEAMVRQAIAAKDYTHAKTMLDGLVSRMDDGMSKAATNQWPAALNATQLVKLLVESANTGIPLTNNEIRWLHQQIDRAFTAYVTNGSPAVYRVFDPQTPDGAYPFTPDGDGIDFTFFASLAGTCVAKYRNLNGPPLLDCARLRAWTP